MLRSRALMGEGLHLLASGTHAGIRVFDDTISLSVSLVTWHYLKDTIIGCMQ